LFDRPKPTVSCSANGGGGGEEEEEEEEEDDDDEEDEGGSDPSADLTFSRHGFPDNVWFCVE